MSDPKTFQYYYQAYGRTMLNLDVNFSEYGYVFFIFFTPKFRLCFVG